MSNLANPELVQLMACPVCSRGLAEFEDCLRCTHCGIKYKIRQGIPLLYPPSMNTAHLQEEENLAVMMTSPIVTSKEQFSLYQWDMSKQEFWSMVRSNIQPSPKLFINIGCGYDLRFSQFEQLGYTFINFDMIYDMLATIQKNSGAKTCVGGDVNSLPFKKDIFDCVISIDLIHHESDNLFAILQSFRDLLKSGGTFFLEDPNAWGLFQIVKSIFLPRPLYRYLRLIYHRLKRSARRPADYEFPTNVWRVKAILHELGFQDIKIYPNNAYPCIGETSYRLYKLLSRFEFIRKFHNYHYMLSAVRR